jgi:hypothetical protein
MTRDEAQAAVLAFLDQFIERGASTDVRELRRKLATDVGAQKALQEQIPAENPSAREAFDGMRELFAIELDRRVAPATDDGPDLVLLASWTEWNWVTSDGERETADPAQWADWLGSVQLATQPRG